VTGAAGFVGKRLMQTLQQRENCVPIAGVRKPSQVVPGQEALILGTIGGDTLPSLQGIDVVVHCAARVHVVNDTARDPLEEFRQSNVLGTLSLAEQAARDGVKRFIFLSSIKVNGESTVPGVPFTAADDPAPVDPYGVSKAEAELALRELAGRTGLDIVIVRPVLVYGPGVKGNFLSMLRWIQRGIPLPLGAVDNRRSIVSVDNLCDLLAVCVSAPEARGETFLASDEESLSTTDLLRLAGDSFGRSPRLFKAPVAALGWGAGLVGRYGQFQRLFGTLEADISHNQAVLGWTPPQSSAEGLRRTVAWFVARQ